MYTLGGRILLQIQPNVSGTRPSIGSFAHPAQRWRRNVGDGYGMLSARCCLPPSRSQHTELHKNVQAHVYTRLAALVCSVSCLDCTRGAAPGAFHGVCIVRSCVIFNPSEVQRRKGDLPWPSLSRCLQHMPRARPTPSEATLPHLPLMHLTTDGFESRVPTAPLLAIVRASGCGNRILSRKRTHIFMIPLSFNCLFAVGPVSSN